MGEPKPHRVRNGLLLLAAVVFGILSLILFSIISNERISKKDSKIRKDSIESFQENVRIIIQQTDSILKLKEVEKVVKINRKAKEMSTLLNKSPDSIDIATIQLEMMNLINDLEIVELEIRKRNVLSKDDSEEKKPSNYSITGKLIFADIEGYKSIKFPDNFKICLDNSCEGLRQDGTFRFKGLPTIENKQLKLFYSENTVSIKNKNSRKLYKSSLEEVAPNEYSLKESLEIEPLQNTLLLDYWFDSQLSLLKSEYISSGNYDSIDFQNARNSFRIAKTTFAKDDLGEIIKAAKHSISNLQFISQIEN